MRLVRKKKRKTADVYRLMALALMSIALPVTFLLVQNPTNTQNEAARETDIPSVESVTVYPYTKEPQTAILGVDEELSMTSFGYFDTVRYYLHGEKDPSVLDNISETYNPAQIDADKFYFLGESDTTVKFQVPQTAGTYYYTAHSVKDGKVCHWNDTLYSGRGDGSMREIGACSNIGARVLKVVNPPSLSRFYLSPGTVMPGDSFSVNGLFGAFDAQEESVTYRIYLHGTGELTGNERIVQSYSPQVVDDNTIYYLGDQQGSQLNVIYKAPLEKGVYKVLVHTEVNGTVGCDWNDRLYKRNTDSSMTYVGSCNNIGPRNLIVY